MIIVLFLVALVLVMIRAVIGPTVPDRIVALDAATTVSILIFCFVAYTSKEWFLIDIALVFVFLSFIATIIISRYLRGDFE